jgi:putative DNA primase/helicase
MAEFDNIIKLAELQDRGQLPPTSEEAMALEFAARHEQELRYIAAFGRWHHFDGIRWQADDTLHVFDYARTICREVALNCDKAAGSIANAKTVAAIERLARSDRRLAATTHQWDAQPWLLNAGDETIDLRCGDARTPQLHDYITKKAACAVAPPCTPHPLWTTFLARITDYDEDLSAFLQRYVGYCLTGHTIEHKFVFAYGTGANGKGTFLNTIAGIFGDYATTADMGTFTASTTERHPTDVAKLAGARLVTAQETQKGRRWDEAKIKALTGGDTMTARFMRQDFFDFVPTFKLFIAGNHKPRLSGIDEAMRRRLLLIPFTVQIPAAERDLKLAEKLRHEWPAILRWCVEGCLQWQRTGLAPPKAVQEATENYFAEQDTLGQWLEEMTEDAGPLAFSRVRELFESWKGWCDARNHRPGSAAVLADMLADRGYVRKREPKTGQRGFTNIVLRRVG